MSHSCSHGHQAHSHLEHYQSCKFLSTHNQSDCFCEEPTYRKASLLALVSASVAGIGAFFSGSLALLSDLAHTLFDGADAFLSLLILKIVRKHPNSEYQVRTMGAKIACAMLIFVVYGIIFEGVSRLANPEPINSFYMIFGASANILVNTYVAWFSHRIPEAERTSTHAQLSLHALSDLLVSVIALVAAILISVTGKTGVDGVAAILVGIYIAWKLLPRSFERIAG